MKKIFILTIAAMATAFFLSQCKKLTSAVQDTASKDKKSLTIQKMVNDYNSKQWSPKTQDAFKTNMAKFNALKDTNNMDATTTPATMNYQVRYNVGDKQLIAAQQSFIKSSGFLLLDEPISVKNAKAVGITVTSSSTVNGVQLASMTDDFESADARYKAFVSKNSSNGFLPVFKQDVANLIIRKYLLNDASKTTELNAYVNDLINSGSQDYALIYLSLNKLKDQVSSGTLAGYKSTIANNKDAQKYRKQLKIEHDALAMNASALGGQLGQALNYQASILEIPAVRAKYFMNKINKITKTSIDM
ncbi:hypothetical protein [Mucilaginibacter sp. dw_454]|uniref:hypothetical protein n=1 Tax=Mucilaginibacter sp. dw_454 TaxID=2720079 RepID=UPI001BD45636|nr:hypothetical protein [Mucilaginibacter sp. dw_454]